MRTRIKELREDKDLSQAQVAKAIGITQRKYSYLETETQPLTDEILVKLSKFYKVTTDYILYLKNNPNDFLTRGVDLYKITWSAIDRMPDDEKKIIELTGKGLYYENKTN